MLKFMTLILKVDENGHSYILFRTNVYFSEYILAVEVDEKGYTDRDFIFEKKGQKALEKNLVVILLELILVKKIITQTMKLVEYKHLLVNLKTKKRELEGELKEKLNL